LSSFVTGRRQVHGDELAQAGSFIPPV